LTEKQLWRGVFPSVQDLERCLKNHLKTCNENPRLLVWTKSAAPILAQVEWARLALPNTP